MRAALYLRVSTDDQTTDNQYSQLWAAAARAGWTIVAVYEDAGHLRLEGPRSTPRLRPAAPGDHAPRDRRGDGLVGRPARPLAAGPGGVLRRAARRRLRPLPAPAGRRHHHAGRPGAVPDARRVRRVRARDHRRARPRRHRPRPRRGQASRPAAHQRRDRAGDPGGARRRQGHPQGGPRVRRRRLGGAADQGLGERRTREWLTPRVALHVFPRSAEKDA